MTVRSDQSLTLEDLTARSQHSFSRLWDGYETDAAAKAARDEAYRLLRSAGIRSRRSVLKNQLKQYASLGVPDGRSCDCYYLGVLREDLERYAREAVDAYEPTPEQVLHGELMDKRLSGTRS
jgi:hypothetical protein